MRSGHGGLLVALDGGAGRVQFIELVYGGETRTR